MLDVKRLYTALTRFLRVATNDIATSPRNGVYLACTHTRLEQQELERVTSVFAQGTEFWVMATGGIFATVPALHLTNRRYVFGAAVIPSTPVKFSAPVKLTD